MSAPNPLLSPISPLLSTPTTLSHQAGGRTMLQPHHRPSLLLKPSPSAATPSPTLQSLLRCNASPSTPASMMVVPPGEGAGQALPTSSSSLGATIVTGTTLTTTTTTHNNTNQHKKQAADIAAEALRISRESLCQDLQALLPKGGGVLLKPPGSLLSRQTSGRGGGIAATTRLNKFVRRLHDMLQAEKDGGIIEWRKGLLVLHSTADFAKNILPKHFNTKNFKTFRRQLNYYGFVHVRSFSTAAASSTTALWVNQQLAESGSADISSVLTLKRVEPCELQKTAEGRRQRKEMALHTVEEDLQIDPKTLQLEQIQNLARTKTGALLTHHHVPLLPTVPLEIAISHGPTTATSSRTHSKGRATTPPKTGPISAPSTTGPAVVSDDTQSSRSSSTSASSSSSSSAHMRHGSVLPDELDDSLGAANLLLLLSRRPC